MILLLLLGCGVAPERTTTLPDGRPSALPDSGDPVDTADTADTADTGPPDDSDSGHTGDSTPDDTGDPSGLPTGKLTIGFWCGPPADQLTEARFAEIAAAGFTTVSNACDSSTYTTTYNLQMLALADAAGLDATVTDSRGIEAAGGVNVASNAAALVADYSGEPALRAFHVYDEPSTAAFANLATLDAELAARDATHFMSVNLLPDYATTDQLGASTYDSYVTSFLATVSPASFTYDHYNFLSDGTDGATFFANLASVRAGALAYGVPFGQYIQAISYNGHRATTGAEKRWAAMHTLAYGGTGVYYFTYWTPAQTSENFGEGILSASGTQTSQYADVAAINADLAVIGRFLAAATSTKVYHHGALASGTSARSPGDRVYVPSTAPLTIGEFSVGSGAYAMIVNRDHGNAVDTDVYVGTSDGRVQQLDPSPGAFVDLSTRVDTVGTAVHLSLAAGDAALLYLDAPADGPVGAEAWFGRVRSDAGALDVVDSRFGTLELTAAGWDTCPAGSTLAGHDFQSNGFWLCVPDEYAGHAYYVGNVVGDVGNLYLLTGGVAYWLGGGSWDSCPTGSLIAHRFDSNGYWVCME